MEDLMGSTNIKLFDLRCEYRINPLGIDVLQPRLSWKLMSEQPGALQTAYQLKVWDEKGELWDSGKISSDRSIHVPYNGPVLYSGQRCHWQVRVWDGAGANQPSEWSEATWWEMGLLHTSDWQAKWIEPGWDEDPALFNPAPFLRTEFSTDQEIISARIYITAHGLYELHLNGERVGDAYLTPGYTSYHKRLQYQVYDVLQYLQAGQNAVGVILGDGWYRGKVGAYAKRNFYGDRLGLLFQLVLQYRDGREEVIISDESWQAATGPLLKSDLQDGEIYDARLEMSGWHQSGFEASGWLPVREANYPRTNLVATIGNPVRRHERFKPVAIFTTPAGETVLDMGQNFSGVVQIRAASPAGTEIKLRHGEALDKYGNFTDKRLGDGEDMPPPLQEVRYILKGNGEEVYTPHFTTHGFRYVLVEGFPGVPTPGNFTGIALYSDLPQTGTFNCSDSRINQLQHNIVWGQKSNFTEIPTDSPTRERAGWTGDAQIFASTASFLMETAGFLGKWLKDLAVDQTPDGRVPNMIPDIKNELTQMLEGSAGWGDAATTVPWTLYKVYGDTRILKEQYASMKAWVEYQRCHSRDYLWNNSIHWGEWLEPDAPDMGQLAATLSPAEMLAYMQQPEVATAYFAYSAQVLAEAATILGESEDALEYSVLHQNIKEAYIKEFIRPDGRVGADKQHSYARALAFNLVPDELRPLVVGRLVDLIREAGNHLATGFLSTTFLCHVLSGNGYLDLAYELLLQDTPPSWLHQVKKGATTIWESWNGIDEEGNIITSLNHYSPGAIGSWLYKVVAGIESGAPGYKHILFQPQSGGGLSYARATYQSLYGEIESRWQLEEAKYSLFVKVPANTRGTIVIPARLGQVESVNGQPLEAAEGVTGVRREPDSTFIEVGSGSYTLKSGPLPT